MRRFVLALLFVLVYLVIPPRAEAAPPFEATACPFAVPRDLAIRCGYLLVPEDRSQPDSSLIRLLVAIARGNGTRPDPVVYLSGGPGSSAVGGTVGLARGWARWLDGRDLVVVDQRGTGYSEPNLACRESDELTYALLEQPVGRAEKVARELEALLRCRDRLRQHGVNLAAYTSAASAQDLADLRAALGYDEWNLFGISYGTRLALTTLRDQPAGLRSMVLDSVYPPQVHLFRDMPASLDRALQTLFAGCAADTTCAAAYPDLEGTFYRLVERLDAEPVQVRAYDPRHDRRIVITVDGSELVSLTFKMLYNSASIPALPHMIGAAAAGDYGPLAELEQKRLGRMGGFSHGMYFAVECSEEIPFATNQELEAALAAYPRLRGFFAGIIENTPTIWELCAAWGVAEPQPIENEPVYGDVPTLVLAGDYDPVTPPEWGQATAEGLRTSHFYRFPGTGHAVITRGACPATIIRSFLDNPPAAPATGCIGEMGAPNF